jgi:hypothetical protein
MTTQNNEQKPTLKEALSVSLERHATIQKQALESQEGLVEALENANNLADDYKCFLQDVEREVLNIKSDPQERLNNIWALVEARKDYNIY